MSRYGCILYPMNKKFISGIRIERRKEKRVPSPRPLGPYSTPLFTRIRNAVHKGPRAYQLYVGVPLPPPNTLLCPARMMAMPHV